MTSITKLQQAAERARQAFQDAQDAAELAAQAAEQRRQVALDEYDRARLAGYSDVALEVEEAAARDRLAEAALSDSVLTALGDMYAAQLRRYLRHGEAVGDAARLGVTAALPTAAAVVGTPTFADVVAVVIAEASRRVADEQDARDAERTAVGEKAAVR